VHSRYERRICENPVGGQETVIHLLVRRFFCRNDACGKKTFAEQVPGLTVRYGRRSTGLNTALQAIALALGGRAGARLTGRLATAVNRMTLIRMIRALPGPALTEGPRVLGVDDFALRRGRVYGTILIDIDTSRPVDLLPERSADSLAAWLDEHPGVQIVCRDRAGCYAEGAARGAPAAVQVADRWHMWHNLGEAVERVVAKHRAHLRTSSAAANCSPASGPSRQAALTPEEKPEQVRTGRLTDRTRQRHAAIHQRITQGQPLRQIARELGLGRNTVRRFARAETPEELLAGNRTGLQPKTLDTHADYLRQRWDQGCTNAEQLWRELRARGYRGRPTTVRQYLRPWRSGSRPPEPVQGPPTVRQVTGWLLRNPRNLSPDDQHRLEAILAECPQLASTRDHVRDFADMMMHRRGDQLHKWMSAVQADDLPDLHSFVTGLRRDLDAAAAGLTLPYSSGPVEGHVNRIKMLKRQMYGRANPDLLRKRVLLAD
jgi:transposase